MTNRQLYNQICREAYSSIFWSRKNIDYPLQAERYAPMIVDSLFISLFNEWDIVGSIHIERKLGRRLRVEELIVCRLSCNYLLFGKPLITETEEEREKLLSFQNIIRRSITRYETSAKKWEKRTKPYPIKLYYFDNENLIEEKYEC